VVNLVVWLHILLGPYWCMSVALFGMSLIPNSATCIISHVDVIQHYQPFDFASFLFYLFIVFLKMELKFVLNGMFRFRLREFTEKLLQELYDVYTYFASSQILFSLNLILKREGFTTFLWNVDIHIEKCILRGETSPLCDTNIIK